MTNQNTTRKHDPPLLPDDSRSCFWSLTDDEIRICFKRSLYQEIIGDISFQRLSNISFLGAIDFVLPRQRNIRRHTNTRLQHTLGVAKLALRFAQQAELSEQEEKLIVVGALLHDIGHAPLSHSLEPIFDAEFGLNHHAAGEKILRGESPLGTGVLHILRSNGIDPEEVSSLIAGKHKASYSYIFSSPMNIDTFEGILRCRRYMRKPIAFTPDSLLDGLLTLDKKAQSRFDDFWQAKHFTYQFLINGLTGIIADAISRKYMCDNLRTFSFDDYFIDENQLFKKHKLLSQMLHRAKQLLQNPLKEPVGYKRREFYLAATHPISNYADLFSRYLQRKSRATIEVPHSLAGGPDLEQRLLFETLFHQ